MNMPVWLLRLLPLFEYICPKCRKEVKKNSHECSHCGEKFPSAIRVPPSFLKDPKKLEAYVHKHVFPKVSPATRDYLAQFFTELFNNGFEEGNFSAWTGTVGSPAVVSAQHHHGSYCEEIDAGGEYAYKTFAAQTTVFVRFYVRTPDTLPPSSGNYISFAALRNASTMIWEGPYITRSGTDLIVRLYRYYATAGFSSSTAKTFAPSTWYCFEVKFVKAVAGEYRVYLDGVEVINYSGNTSAAPDAATINVGNAWYSYSSGDPWPYHIDCVMVADAYIGPESGVTVQTVNDSLSLADTTLRNKTFLPVSDSVGLADSLYGNKFLLLGDSASLSELVTVIMGEVTKYVTDSVSIADVANVLKTLTTSDTVTLVDAASTPSRVLQALEALGMADSVVVNKVLQITEAISLAEVVQVGAGGVKKTKLFLILGDLAVQLTGD